MQKKPKRFAAAIKAGYLFFRRRKLARKRGAIHIQQSGQRVVLPSVVQNRTNTRISIGPISVQKRFLALLMTGVTVFVTLMIIIFSTGKEDDPQSRLVVIDPTQMATIEPFAYSSGADATPTQAQAQTYGDEAAEQDEDDELRPLSTISYDNPTYEKISPNTESARVAWLQQRLMDLDYLEPDEPTEFYGFQTKYAVQLFQREAGLMVDGIAGEETLTALFAKDAKPYTVYHGDYGTDVKEFQLRLKELGYFSGSATGKFGDETEAAVKKFQERNKLSADGRIGIYTREALYSDKVIFAPMPSTPKPTKKPSGSSSSSTPVKPVGKGASALISFAKKHLGKKYVRGAKGPSSFDCSGFVYYCLKNSGVKLSYMTSAGWAKSSSYTKITSRSKLKAGDILCFRGHVGIYIGGGQMIDASSSKGKVRITSINSDYWVRNFLGARRVF